MYSRGFTLLEMLFAVALATLTCIIASIFFPDWLKRMEAQRVSAELYSLALAARSDSAVRHAPVTLCGSSDGKHCDLQWAEGILVFRDSNRSQQVDAGEDLIRYSAIRVEPSRVTWSGFSGDSVIFESTGTSYAGNGTFTYCTKDKDARFSRQIIINRSGRPRTSRDSDHDGKHEGSNGQPIVCP